MYDIHERAQRRLPNQTESSTALHVHNNHIIIERMLARSLAEHSQMISRTTEQLRTFLQTKIYLEEKLLIISRKKLDELQLWGRLQAYFKWRFFGTTGKHS